ncbi:MAG: DUF3769 domain-containing protein [Leptolyngbyaceae cyanobacterium MO_188.B28]|nr:DUF3769 domain-containing protein [Leptolyngbyaceae cyanobacterium MO_188.B28]
MPYPVLPPAPPPAIEVAQASESSNLSVPLSEPSSSSSKLSDLLSSYSDLEDIGATPHPILSPLTNRRGNTESLDLETARLKFQTLQANQAAFLGGPLSVSINSNALVGNSPADSRNSTSLSLPVNLHSPELADLQPTFADASLIHQENENTIQPDLPVIPSPALQPAETHTETNIDTGEAENVETDIPLSPTQEVPRDISPPQPNAIETESDLVNTLELTADQQEYNPEQQVITAQGNVVMKVANGILGAEQLWVNLVNRYAVAEGNVILTRGEQILRGERVEYNFIQGKGSFFNASGEIFLPSVSSDISSPLPNDIAAQANAPISDRLTNQPVQNVRTTGGLTFATGTGGFGRSANGDPRAQRSVRRVRFEAAQIDFDAEGWQAENVRVTNDPFSPPELELRANTARLRTISLTQDELRTSNLRVVFDQGFTLPLFRSRFLLNRGNVDNNDVNPLAISIGIDGDDRGGIFFERTFKIVSTDRTSVRLTPQFFAQRFIGRANSNPSDPSVYGLVADTNIQLGPRTAIRGVASLTSLEFDQLEDNARTNLQAQQLIGDHALTLEYSFRDRLFNGSLGFQDIQRSVGAILTSPNIALGNSGVNLSYQASAQYINAETDRSDLLDPMRNNDRISLGRFQASAALSRGFLLWQGKALAPTATEGLRYTPAPIVPSLSMFVGVRGVATQYTSNDFQGTVTGSIGMAGELGHFSRPFFDYTKFNITYSQALLVGTESPFKFDRDEDRQVLSGGIIQQIYGPLRVGFQTSFNLNSSEEINTDLILEYSRRTYGLLVRFNPVQRTGFIGLRINDFDWTGGSPAFGGSGIRRVEGGVIR